jgi:hypothetical protein
VHRHATIIISLAKLTQKESDLAFLQLLRQERERLGSQEWLASSGHSIWPFELIGL